MSKNYDNWDRLVGAVLHREKLMQLALSHSRTPSSRSSESSINDFLDENKCCLVDPKELHIAWGDDSRYWNWTSHANSRSPEVAELKTVWWLDIRGQINTRLLSPETTYAAFLVFKLAEGARGLEVANATIRFVKDEQEEHALQRATAVHLQPMEDTTGRVAVQRTNGWMEIEIGNFSFQDGYEGDVEARLLETTTGTMKTGLIIDGIEFRQVYMEATFFPNKGLRNREGRRRGGFSNFTSSKVNESFAVDWEKFLIPDYPKIPPLSSAYQDIFVDQSIWHYMFRTLLILRAATPSNGRQKSNADYRIRRLSEAARRNHMRPLKMDVFSPEFLKAAFRAHEFFQKLRGANAAGSTTRFSSDYTENNAEERDIIVHPPQPLDNRNGQDEIIRGDRQMEIEMGSSSFQAEGELETRSGETTRLMEIGPTNESNMIQAETTLFTKNDLKKRRARGKGVSSIFTSSKINESFAVNWERFLMPDYQEMASPFIYRGLLPDERNGKICCMIGARGLQIAWGDNPLHWKWKSQADSRFSEVAELTYVWWLEIRGKIDIKMLSPRSFYAASLVFRLNERFKLKVANTTVRFVDDETENDAEKRAKVVEFQPSEITRKGQDTVIRDDGWMEIEMGNFYLAEGDVGEVEARLLETAAWSKSGLIVEGIEFRPLCTEVSDALRKVK